MSKNNVPALQIWGGTQVSGTIGNPGARPGTKPGTQKGRMGRPRPQTAPFLGPRLGPWPLGSLAHMVPGPWVPGPYLQGPYLQGRNMTFVDSVYIFRNSWRPEMAKQKIVVTSHFSEFCVRPPPRFCSLVRIDLCCLHVSHRDKSSLD